MTLRASPQGLEIVNKARKKKGWTKTMSSAWWQAALTSQATLKRFWREEPIQEDTFIKICEAVGVSNWREVVNCTTTEEIESAEIPSVDWGEAPDISGFYGRTAELAKLQQWILVDHCRLVALTGIGGIGKTALAAMLADGIQEQFKYRYWRSLRPTPAVEDFLADLLRFLSHPQTPQIPSGGSYPVSQLMDCLRKHRCLVVLDDFDTVLRSGDHTGSYVAGYEGYGELLKRVAETSMNSCLVIISREKPKEIAAREGKTQPIRSFQLMGLQEVEAREILKEKDLLESEEWATLIHLYRGNPLALKVVSTMIQELFNGSVSEFLRQGTLVLGDMSVLLDQQFQRLSSLEKEIMYWLALHRQPVFLSQLHQDILLKVPTSTLLELLTSLGRRSLIEKSTDNGEVLFALQPVVMKYVTNQFVTQVCAEICEEKIELLRSHALVQNQAEPEASHFLSRSILTLVKQKLTFMFQNEQSVIEHLTQILSMLGNKPNLEIGYADHNIRKLFAELNAELKT